MPPPSPGCRLLTRRGRWRLWPTPELQALRETAARYQGLFENAPDAIFWIGVSEAGEFFVESVNPAQVRVLGVDMAGLLGRPLTAWLPPEAAAQVLGNYRRCLAAGEPITYAESADLGTGIRHFETTLVPLRNAAGRFHRIVGISKDITERHRSEVAAREQELLFRRLFEHSGDPNLLIEDSRFVDCNQATADILGASSKVEVLGTHPSQLSPPFQPDGRPSQEKADHMIAQAYRQGFHRFEWVHRKLDGTLFQVEVLLTVVPYRGKQLLHTTWRDRTEALQAEAERRRMEAQIRDAQKMESLGVLAGGIAHDFNNLLTAILGNLNMAQLRASEGRPSEAFLRMAETAVVKAADLTRQMLAYSGRGRFVVQRHDLNGVVRDMAHLLRVSISKKADLRLDLAEGLPPIEADGAQFQQVVLNLVTNASEALGDQEGLIELRTDLADLSAGTLASALPGQDLRPGRYVTLEVRDSGQGMSPEVRARIFDPFFTTKATGRGLGLSAMLGILRGHQAGLELSTAPGEGSSFKVYFPAASGEAEAPPEAAASNPQRLRGRVLLVDDEPFVLDAARVMLEALGLEVVTARDGQEAVDRVKAAPAGVDLVLMDLTMPRMDGHEAYLALHALRPDLPVILTSGYSEQESIQPLLGQGLAGFLQKPYPLETLRSLIQATLRGRPPGSS